MFLCTFLQTHCVSATHTESLAGGLQIMLPGRPFCKTKFSSEKQGSCAPGRICKYHNKKFYWLLNCFGFTNSQMAQSGTQLRNQSTQSTWSYLISNMAQAFWWWTGMWIFLARQLAKGKWQWLSNICKYLQVYFLSQFIYSWCFQEGLTAFPSPKSEHQHCKHL